MAHSKITFNKDFSYSPTGVFVVTVKAGDTVEIPEAFVKGVIDSKKGVLASGEKAPKPSESVTEKTPKKRKKSIPKDGKADETK